MSVIHSLIQRITTAISGRSQSSGGLYQLQDYMYDYAIGGVPFLSATTDQRPDSEGPVEQRKQQFDNQTIPGEQSLSAWWLRSQGDFGGGAGILYQDPDTQTAPSTKNTRFHQSLGLDCFTDPDHMRLLKDTVTSTQVVKSAYGDTFLQAVVDPFTNATTEWIAQGITVRECNPDSLPGDVTAGVTYTIPNTSVLSDSGIVGRIAVIPPSTSGGASTAYIIRRDPGAAQAGIYKLTGGVATRIYQMPIASTPATQLQMQIGYAHGFLVASYLNGLYVLSPAAAVNTAFPVTPNAIVPVGFVITTITDGPDAIYVGANGVSSGSIYKTTFGGTSGAIDSLVQSAVLPAGESINQIASYVSTYLILATTRSIRVGQFTGGGVTYGPPIVEAVAPNAHDGGFSGIDFFGTRAYVGVGGSQKLHGDSYGLVAVELGTLIQDSNTGAVFNAYALWNYSTAATFPVSSVSVTSRGRVLFGLQSRDISATNILFVEHTVNLIASGFFDTGRCRFGTEEPKLFKYISVRTPSLQGNLSVAVLDAGGGVTNYLTYGPSFDPGTDDIATPTPPGPQIWEALRFTLARNATDPTIGAELDSWQIKALPGTLKQRLITKNFLCFNAEVDKSGQVIQGDSSSLDRLTAVRQMCQRGDTVVLQDLVNNISDQVIIDNYQFTMLSPPGPNKENYGGYLTVQMRTVADSVPPIQSQGSGNEDDA